MIEPGRAGDPNDMALGPRAVGGTEAGGFSTGGSARDRAGPSEFADGVLEPKSGDGAVYRADQGPQGRWFVWQRLGSGWSALQGCADQTEAHRLATRLNSLGGSGIRRA